jgi:hypothetical protein
LGNMRLPTIDRAAGWIGSPADLRSGPLARFIGKEAVVDAATLDDEASASHETVLALGLLQDLADYRGALRTWVGALRTGGHLIVSVPHAFLFDRQLQLPSRLRPTQRRLYTARSLLDEVEEALTPNSYRVRMLYDDDSGYDYLAARSLIDAVPEAPTGHSAIVLVLEKIAQPAWRLDAIEAPKLTTPDYAFEAPRTRVEVIRTGMPEKVVILKLDHMGDFIMGLPGLEKARATFAGAEITLVVGSWNADMAREMGVADRVIAFDAFPRNSTEEEVDVPGKVGLFRKLVPGKYDLAIDLRTDKDTRVLLRAVDASIKAGVGTRAEFPWLDIFLPLDFNRNEPETAAERRYNHYAFSSQGSVIREAHRLISEAHRVERDCAIIWGPFDHLRPGRYFFEPFIEIDKNTDGLLMLDVGLDAKRAVQTTVPPLGETKLYFDVEEPNTRFEARVWTVEAMPSVDFSFFGGRLVREGAASVLHQSEYLQLLIELVTIRLMRTGVLTNVEAA